MRVVLEIGDWILAEDDEGEVRLWSNSSTGETRSYEDMPIEVEAKLRENAQDQSADTNGEALEATLPLAIENPGPAISESVGGTGATEPTPFRRQRGVMAAPPQPGSALSEPLLAPLHPVTDTILPDSVAPVGSINDPVLPDSLALLEGACLEVADEQTLRLQDSGNMENVGQELACVKSEEIVLAETHEPPPEVPRPANLPSVPERAPTQAMLVSATSMKQHHGQSQQQFLGTLTHLHLGRKGLTSLGDAANLCGRLKVLNLEGNHFQEIQGLRPNCTFEVLHLQGNDVWNLSTWSQSLPSLRSLDLSENFLTLVAGLDNSRGLEELNLRGQRSGVPLQFHTPTLNVFARSLHRLDVSRNRITDISPVASLLALEQFFANSNMLSDLTHVGNVLQRLGRLKRLGLAENPACSTFKYRDLVIISASESLEELDDKAIQRHERAFLVKMHQRRRERTSENGSSAGSSPTVLTPPAQRRSRSLAPLPPRENMAQLPGHPPVPCNNRSRSSSRDPSGRQYRRKSTGPAKLPPLPPRIGS